MSLLLQQLEICVSFGILSVAIGGRGSSEQESVASLSEIITSYHPTERCNIKSSLWIPIQPDSRTKDGCWGRVLLGFRQQGRLRGALSIIL